MKRRIGCLIGLLVLVSIHLSLYSHTFIIKGGLDRQARINFVLPAEFSRVAALDFEGLAADFQLLQGIFFIGDKIDRQEKITGVDWDYFTRIINAVIKLDPYFYDTYHFATGMLTWGSGRFQDAINILKYGQKFNKNDYRFPYHIGFIYFYFLHDVQNGAKYFELASRVPGAPPILASLASRLAYYGGNYAFSINLLRRMLSSERSPEIKKYYKIRLDALQGALTIEKAVQKFKTDHSRFPEKIKELLVEKYLTKVPQDPYGGDYYIKKNGRVYSTSKFANASSKEKKRKEPSSQ